MPIIIVLCISELLEEAMRLGLKNCYLNREYKQCAGTCIAYGLRCRCMYPVAWQKVPIRAPVPAVDW